MRFKLRGHVKLLGLGDSCDAAERAMVVICVWLGVKYM